MSRSKTITCVIQAVAYAWTLKGFDDPRHAWLVRPTTHAEQVARDVVAYLLLTRMELSPAQVAASDLFWGEAAVRAAAAEGARWISEDPAVTHAAFTAWGKARALEAGRGGKKLFDWAYVKARRIDPSDLTEAKGARSAGAR